MLAIDDLRVQFDDLEVLRGITFRLSRGKSLAVIGPNGAGKTVLFKALIGAIPFKGSVRWQAGTKIGYVPQKLDLERDIPITAMDFLKARGCGKAEEISTTLDRVGMSRNVASKLIGTLSGGQFQRLLIAFALLGDPNVLMLDEPTSGIDEPGQRQVDDLIQDLQRSRDLTVLFISHELSIVSTYADDVLCLGRAGMCIGPTQHVLTPDVLQRMYGSPIAFHHHEH